MPSQGGGRTVRKESGGGAWDLWRPRPRGRCGKPGRSLHRAVLEGIPLLTCSSVSAGWIMDRSQKGAVEILVSVRRL